MVYYIICGQQIYQKGFLNYVYFSVNSQLSFLNVLVGLSHIVYIVIH